MMGSLDLTILVTYFVVVIGFGVWAGRHSRGMRDFFLGGQRFAWWMVGFSCLATVVGSYSFVKYSAAGYSYGLSSSQTYLNDWYWMPLWMFGWLPIVYYARIVSVPEFFDRRFGRPTRHAATFLLLLYLVGYLGINFLTMGKALHALAGWDLLACAAVAALVCGAYTAHGGQTAVIFTDLLQGAILLVAGLALFAIGVVAAGGPLAFWDSLGAAGQRAFPGFAHPPEFNFVGIFWQDGFVGGIAFFFMNQSILTRFLAARSVAEARKGAAFVLLVLMPLAAIAVSGAGWVGRALVAQGQLDPSIAPDSMFVVVARHVLPTGLFGFTVAALVAALMSSADSLINAIATISIVDLWRPWRERHGPVSEKRQLRAARWSSAIATLVGFLLVPVFASFGGIYRAHGAFVAAVTPPLAVALVLGFTWKRFSAKAALLVMIGGSLLVAASLVWPALVTPFAHGIDLEAGSKGYSYIRALYGLVVCSGLGILGALIWPQRDTPAETLVVGPIDPKRAAFKGGTPRTDPTTPQVLTLGEPLETGSLDFDAEVHAVLDAADADPLAVSPGDLISVRDAHWINGAHRALVARVITGDPLPGRVRVSENALRRLGLAPGERVRVERLL